MVSSQSSLQGKPNSPLSLCIRPLLLLPAASMIVLNVAQSVVTSNQ